MNEANETIAAIATASGGGVGIVRISGVAALDIAQRMLGHAATPRHAYFTKFRDSHGRAIDHGLLLAFVAPASFTGEDVVELHAHGNAFVLETLLARVCELGARRARAGEFSERAFLNGKLDLAQAEAMADLIVAGSERQVRAAMRSLDGDFSKEVDALLTGLTHVRSHLEAAIDFTDDDIDFLADPALAARLEKLSVQLAALLESARRGQQLRDGLYVVITGAPNVGKSSLLNALARSDRAIVTATPGTTRDVLRETVTLGGTRIELVDTAGLRDTLDPVEAEGVRRAHAERARADLVIEVLDATATAQGVLIDGAPALLPARYGTSGRGEEPTSPQHIIVHNKIDLIGAEPHIEGRNGVAHSWLSAHDGRGVELLEALLAERAGGGESAGTFSARARHVRALERTRDHVELAQMQLVDARAGELAAEELRQAQQALGEITGTFTPDDLLARIFSTFCIGK